MSQPQIQSIKLASVLDVTAAEPLLETLKAVRGRPIDLDAAEVTRASTLCLQVLLSAEKTWRQDEVPFRIVTPSEAFTHAIGVLGISSSLTAMDGANS